MNAVKKHRDLPLGLHTILQMLSVNLSEKTLILQAFLLDDYKE